MGVLTILIMKLITRGALLFGVYIRAPDFWKLPALSYHDASTEFLDSLSADVTGSTSA